MATVYKTERNDSHQKLSLESMLCSRAAHDSEVQWKFTYRDFMYVIRVLYFHPVPNRSPFDLLITLIHAERFQLSYTEADRMRGFIASACLISRPSQREWRKQTRCSVRYDSFSISGFPTELSKPHALLPTSQLFSLMSQVLAFMFSTSGLL